MVFDGFLTGIVGGQGEREIFIVFSVQVFQVADTTLQILIDIKSVFNPVLSGCIRHELHKTDGALLETA